MSNTQFKQPWSIWDFAKLHSTCVPHDPEDWKSKAKISVRVVNGNPRLRVYMNDGVTKGAQTVNLDIYDLGTLTELVKEAAESKEPMRTTMEVKSNYIAGQKQDKLTITGKVSIGRNQEGFVFMNVGFKGVEKAAKFIWQPSYYCVLTDSAGERVENMRASTLVAKSWAKTIDFGVNHFFWTNTKEKEANRGSGKDKEYSKSYSNNSQGGGGNGGGFDGGEPADW